MIIQHNIAALNSHRQLSINNASTSKNLEKLSSGYRINRAGDDAAGLAISEKMRGQIRGLSKAEENTSHAINLIQTAEGGLQETHAILQRMRELAVQSANGTYDNPNDRMNLQKEFERLTEEIDRIADATHYNGIDLLSGALGEHGPSDASFKLAFGSVVSATNPGLVTDNTSTFAITLTNNNGVLSGSVVATPGTGGSLNNATVSIDGDTVTITADDGGSDSMVFTVSLKTGYLRDGDTLGFRLEGTGDNTLAIDASTFSYNAAVTSAASFGLTFQIGANGSADQRMNMFVEDMHAAALGDGTTDVTQTSIALQDDANDAIEVINAAINQVSAQRAELGAAQNRLEHTMNNLGVTKENLTAAESTIRDVDMAKEMMEYTKNSILVQASQAMLAQAQSLPQGVLQLLS